MYNEITQWLKVFDTKPEDRAELDAEDLHGRVRELTPISCGLSSTYVIVCATCPKTHQYKKNLRVHFRKNNWRQEK